MKRWGVLTAGLYACALVLLTVPVIEAAFPGASNVARIYGAWGYWLWVGFMTLCALLLIAAPVRLAGVRDRSRKPVYWTVGVTGLLFAFLVLGAALSIGELLAHDRALNWLGTDTSTGLVRLSATVLGLWALWAAVLYWMTRRVGPIKGVRRAARALLAGSILELLVAVPSHIIVRGRTECCAGVYTFLGLVTGTSIMLLSFGPGVFFLFRERALRISQATRQPEV